MNLARPRGAHYEILAADDDQDYNELQSVLTSDQLDQQLQASAQTSSSLLQKRPSPSHYLGVTDNSYDDDNDNFDDDDWGHYSSSSDNEKPYLRTNPRSSRMPDSPNALFPDQPKLTRCNRVFLSIFAIFIVVWVSFALYLGIGRLVKLSQEGMANMQPSFQFEDMFNQSFAPKYQSLAWMPYGDDGVYSRINAAGDIILTNVDGSEPKVFLPGANVTDARGKRIPFFSFFVSPDEKYVLLGTDRRKQWRHSFNASYYIYSMENYQLTPLLESAGEPGVEHVAWSPVGHSLAYVQNNNLYIYQDLVHRHQITFDGAVSIFNGITDWVYEEEVYASPSALWWSPDGTAIAFLRFDETEVPEFHYSLYMDNQINAPAYPRDVVMKYPKVGFPNPIVNLHMYNLKSALVPTTAHPLEPIVLDGIFEPKDRIIAEVKWATEGSDALLVKVQNRVQNHEKLVLVNPTTLTGKVVREWNAGIEDGGWIDMQQSIRYVAPSKSVPEGGYLDIVNNNGYNHIALYTPIDNPAPKWLTSGEWEVQSIAAVNGKEGLVYYISTEKSSLERHLYSVTLDSADRKSLTDVTLPGYYTASFSTGAGYYLLSYRGPDVPWQKVKKSVDEKFISDVEDNAVLRALLNATQVPTRRWSTVNLNGRECNYMEFLPPGFSPEQKHPVLFQVYGGPGSQLVDTQFQLGFSAVMSTIERLKYVVVVVDGRGTGYRGRDFRISVVNQLGKFEVEDQIAAGKHWQTLSYVDPDRVAIWGWSYGGFMAAKITEANSGVFRAAMSVAPVTDFRFYDSVYTERYMNLPTTNLDGYETTAVTNMTGFENSDFLLVHGTGDDNVHVQNAFVLIDRLTLAGNHRYKSHFFTDSDHGIRAHNANHEIYWLLAENLWETMGGFVSPAHHH
ncbi:dipeptidyl peptidase IV N-terminal region-domain-containing protein [Gamsiella multidivaricata]|uniref:dipeptidyl peptidase IV N-terminal region-domain-containing protein n=1 Tax=Gamsiella multidivaricata TaxID=101098 RepID=UPI00221EA29D|nr:dipeptidyl peptidase IV N-terminal region-domain-containing protein [Gamsiella multidivaricata]KAI7824647.1 dipeptidyl peptidase IV N-terminal region-domain-containing protein [Gamsiella multidivaricata]